MVKKFKTKTYEKDNDDHYVVVLNPWTKGVARCSHDQINWIGAWLRIAFLNPKDRDIVKNIYTRNTRSEVIARISSQVDVHVGLGLHRWSEFMEQKALRKVKEQTGVDLSEHVSHIFLYNWKFHGDPSESQWEEWYPLQEPIPRDVMIKWDYPEPEWSEPPEIDGNLRSMLIPMRYLTEPSHVSWNDRTQADVFRELHRNEDKTVVEVVGQRRSIADGQPRETADSRSEAAKREQSFLPEQLVHVQSDDILPAYHSIDDEGDVSDRKMGKPDPYEAEDKALLTLRELVTRQMAVDGIKVKTPDVKPKLEDPGYRPSISLFSAVSQLQNSVKVEDFEERKPFIKREGADINPNLEQGSYRPTASLRGAISQLTSRIKPEPEEKKPTVKKEEYIPIGALRDAYSQYTAMADCTSSSKRNRGESTSRADARASLGSPDSVSVKRVKTEQ